MEQRGKQFHFVIGDAASIPLQVTPRESETAWRAVVEMELATPFDVSVAPLMRVSYLIDEGLGEAELILTLQHVIVDAVSGTALLREILTLCADLAGGETPPQTADLALLPAAEHLFPARYRGRRGRLRCAPFLLRQMADEIGYRIRSRGTRQPPVHAAGQPRILSLELPAAETRTLVRRCRKAGVTLNSALCAALLLTVNRELHAGAATPLRNFNFANLRPYLESPLPDGDLGSYFAMLRITTTVQGDMDCWTLARELNRTVYEAAKRGEKFTNLLMSGAVIRMLFARKSFRMGNTALGYTGVATLPQTYGATRLTELHAFISNFALGPEYTAHVRLFAGRLVWDIVYLDCDMDAAVAEKIGRETLGLLTAEEA